MTIDVTQLRTFISNMYTDVAQFPRGEFHFPTGQPLLEGLGYPKSLLDAVPPSAIESAAGVGYYFHLGEIAPGESVVDLGCGAGTDLLIAANKVGSSGTAVGIDMTDAMVKKSRDNLARADKMHASIHQGYIEELPMPAGSVDVVISNGVINLSPLKAQVFSEVARILKPGGRMMFSDLVTGVELPTSVRENCELWAECIGGALERSNYLALIEEAGLTIERVTENNYKFVADSTADAAAKFQVMSLSILAYKPA